jgi:hypothetical protein
LIRTETIVSPAKAGVQWLSRIRAQEPLDPGLPDCRKTQTGVTVAPAQAGAQWFKRSFHHWIPAFAGMTTLLLRFQIVFDRKSTVCFAGKTGHLEESN